MAIGRPSWSATISGSSFGGTSNQLCCGRPFGAGNRHQRVFEINDPRDEPPFECEFNVFLAQLDWHWEPQLLPAGRIEAVDHFDRRK